MSDVRPQYYPEKPQQELRFTARDPVLDEALALLERDGERRSTYLPKNLFLFAMKRIEIDYSDTFDGQSQNHSTFMQYQKRIDDISGRGKKRFKLAPWLKPLYAGGPEGTLVGVGMRVMVDPLQTSLIIAPPLYGANYYRPPVSPDNQAIAASANKTLEAARKASFIPVRYEIGKAVDDPTEAVSRLEEVLEIGAYVSQMTLVPRYPRSARENDIFREEKIDRTYDRIDELLEEELTPPDEPKNITSMIDPTIERAS